MRRLKHDPTPEELKLKAWIASRKPRVRHQLCRWQALAAQLQCLACMTPQIVLCRSHQDTRSLTSLLSTRRTLFRRP